MGVIKVGTSSWADQSLLRSGWYPRSASTPARRLGFYASQFPMVEVDTSYYAIPVPETDPGLGGRHTGRLHLRRQGVQPLHRSPDTGRRAAPGPATGQRPEPDPPPGPAAEPAYDELWARFRAALDPIAAAGKLGVVMLQFPPWLVRSPAAERRIVELAQRCRPWRVGCGAAARLLVGRRRRGGHSGPATRPRPVPGLRRHATGAPVVGATDPDHDGGAGDRPVPRSQRRLGRGRQAGEVPVRVRRGRASALGRTAGRVRRSPRRAARAVQQLLRRAGPTRRHPAGATARRDDVVEQAVPATG